MSRETSTVQRTSERAIADFLANAQSAFEVAAASRGLVERRFSIASEQVLVRLAGSALAGYALPALDHFGSDPAPRGRTLTISVFDTRSSLQAMPPPPWPTAAYTPTSEIAGIEGDRYLAAFNVGTGVLDILDTESGQALHWIADAASHPAYDVSSPFRLLFHWWMRRGGLQFVHAGAVGRDGRGVLIVGKGGAGKSTIALACLLAGLDFLGDDYVLARSSPRSEAFNLYGSAKLERENLEARFETLAGSTHAYTEPPEGGKAILMLAERFGDRIRPRTELVAIVLPHVTCRDGAALYPASTADALQALLPSTCRQLTAVRKGDVDAMARLIRSLPAFVLELGPKLDGVPGILSELLERSPS